MPDDRTVIRWKSNRRCAGTLMANRVTSKSTRSIMPDSEKRTAGICSLPIECVAESGSAEMGVAPLLTTAPTALVWWGRAPDNRQAKLDIGEIFG